MTVLLQTVISGLVLGGLYGLIALGLTLQYGVSRVMNLAFGEFIIIAAFLSYFAVTLLNLSPLVAVLLIAPVAFGLSYLLYRGLMPSLRKRAPTEAAFEIDTILVTFGVLFILQGLMSATVGGAYHSYSFLAVPIEIGAITLPANRVLAAAISVTCAVCAYLFLTRTRSGTAIRAVAVNPSAAPLVAIDAGQIAALTFALGGTLAAVAGVMLSTFLAFNAAMGVLFTMKALIIVVMGGVGNVLGTLVAGMLLGLAEALTARFVDPGLTLAMNFALFIAVLLLRPQGLFGGVRA